MRSVPLLVMLALATGCNPPQGGLRVTLTFQNEAKTKCVKVTARKGMGESLTAKPNAINRVTDSLTIGIAETDTFNGDVSVTVKRFAAKDCAGAEFDSQTKNATLLTGKITTLEFTYGDAADGGVDGGVDAGVDDGGSDAGCDTSSCSSPGMCQLGPAGCGCVFANAPRGTSCGAGGVCDGAGACAPNPCAVLDAGAACDDGLACTTDSRCQAGLCVGVTCMNSPPVCNSLKTTACASSSACQLVASGDNTSCGTDRLCVNGDCAKWPVFSPVNLRVAATQLPYPDAGWDLASPDGGLCDTVISTSGAGSVMTGECGTPPLVTAVDDAGVMVFEMTSLNVGPSARLHFVGARPAQVIVLGNAAISGTISVAPLITGANPAGTQPASCATVGAGANTKEGGGGAGFGSNGGNGGESGGMGATPVSVTYTPMRGGCAGGAGYSTNAGGIGGGALELIVADTLTLAGGGTITASGGGGVGASGDGFGGGGGGSGGLIILEGKTINLTGGFVTANGGGGGAGGANGALAVNGATGPLSSSTAAPAANGGGGAGGVGGVEQTAAGTNGGNDTGNKGGGGGGGSAGVIYIHAATTCTRGGAVISCFTPTSLNCN